MATMIKDEVEPLGGFIGDAFATPLFLGGQAATAMLFIMVQSFWLGLVAAAVVLLQSYLIPRLRRRILELGRERQLRHASSRDASVRSSMAASKCRRTTPPTTSAPISRRGWGASSTTARSAE